MSNSAGLPGGSGRTPFGNAHVPACLHRSRKPLLPAERPHPRSLLPLVPHVLHPTSRCCGDSIGLYASPSLQISPGSSSVTALDDFCFDQPTIFFSTRTLFGSSTT